MAMWLTRVAEGFRRFFYLFLDISGILLGVFLVGVGWWALMGRTISRGFGGLILGCGVAAFLIHTGHYFHLRITRWIFGSETYFHKDQR